jgi:predicted component of type VI protein secretion system
LETIMRNVLMMTALLLIAGCATNNAATSAKEPEVTLVQLSRVAEGLRSDTGPVSAHYGVAVRNAADTPIHLDRVTVQTIGGGAYDLPAHSQAFDVAIGPKETKSVDFWAPAYVANPAASGANGPVTIRAMLELDEAGRKFQKVVVQNISPAGGN